MVVVAVVVGGGGAVAIGRGGWRCWCRCLRRFRSSCNSGNRSNNSS